MYGDLNLKSYTVVDGLVSILKKLPELLEDKVLKNLLDKNVRKNKTEF